MESLRQYRLWLFGQGEEKGFSSEAVLRVVNDGGMRPFERHIFTREAPMVDHETQAGFGEHTGLHAKPAPAGDGSRTLASRMPN
jgi:hypothetical protein